MYRSLLLALALVAITSSPLSAQSVIHVEAGDQVRLASEDASGEFTVVEVRSDKLVLQASSASAQVEVPTTSLTMLDVRRPRARLARAHRGAQIGLLIGAGSGAVVGALSYHEEKGCWLLCSIEEQALVTAGIGMLLGAAGGAIYGLTLPGGR